MGSKMLEVESEGDSDIAEGPDKAMQVLGVVDGMKQGCHMIRNIYSILRRVVSFLMHCVAC